MVPKGGAQTQKKLGPKGGATKGGATKGRGPKGGGQNFALFFPSPAPMFVLSVSLWGSSRVFLVVFGSAGAVTCSLEFSGCRVKPRRPQE